MKKLIFLSMIISLACISEYSYSQSGQKWSSGGNSISPIEFLGTINNSPLNIKVNNTLALTITTGSKLQLHYLSGGGDGLVVYDNNGILTPLTFSGDNSMVLLGGGHWGPLPIPANYWKLDNSTNHLYTLTPGNVGIGTNNPQYKLDVLGNVRITENLYVGGGIIITDKVRASGDIKSTALEADSIKMDSTKAFYGYSKFTDAVKLENRLDVHGNTYLYGDLTTSGNIKYNSFSGNGNGLIAYDNLGTLKSIAFPNSTSKVLLGDGSWGSIPIPANYWLMNGDDIYTLTPGNIGIGTSTPQVKLDIDGDVRISSNLYVGGGIVISDKVNATSEVITKDLKSMSLKADSIIMDSTRAFYGYSKFIDDVKLDNKLNVNGDVQFNGNFTTSGNINFAGNKTIGYQPPSSGNPEIYYIGTPPILAINLCYPSTIPYHQFSGVYQSTGMNGSDFNVMSMGYNGTNFMIDIATNGIISNTDPGLLINNYCSRNVSICTGAGGNVQLTSLNGKVGIGVLPNAASPKLDIVGDVRISTLLTPTNLVQIGTDGILIPIPLEDIGAGLWQKTNDDIYNTNTENVGIGTDNPQKKLHIKHFVDNSGDDPNDPNPPDHTGSIRLELELSSGQTTVWDIEPALNTNVNIPSKLFFNAAGGSPTPVMTLFSNNNVSIGIQSYDQARLFVKNTSSFGGIISSNTASSAYAFCAEVENVNTKAFVVKNNNQEKMVVLGSGNVGIGTATPNAMLHVAGSGIITEFLAVGTVNNNAKLSIENNDIGINNGAGLYVRTLHSNSNGYGIISEVGQDRTKAITVKLNGNENVVVYGDGEICARRVHVKLDAFFDNVLQPEYKLLSLYDLKTYIDQNSHLPDVPSEKEVLENGVSLGEFNSILLKKIEELTLYVIQQQSEIDELKRQISK